MKSDFARLGLLSTLVVSVIMLNTIDHQLGGMPSGGTTTRISVASDGTEGNWYSSCPSISLDGRFVAFWSYASNLVDHDTNGRPDIFLHDRQTGQTRRVSVSSEGMQANGDSYCASISADGMYVTFGSEASNLVSYDTNDAEDIFVFEVATGQVWRVSVASDGEEANNFSFGPSISGDGRYIAFTSNASNLVPEDNNGGYDIFVHDRQTHQTIRASIATGGEEGNGWSESPSLSADGRFVAFGSYATNLVNGDPDDSSDVFVHNLETGETYCVSLIPGTNQPAGNSWSASISADGRLVAFESHFPLIAEDINLSGDIYVYDRQTGVVSLESRASLGAIGDDDSYAPSLSADGSLVAFYSEATNLVNNDTNSMDDVFVRYRQGGKTIRASVASDGRQANKGSSNPSVSGDGGQIAFKSWANNLVEGDTNGYADIFIHEPGYIEPTPTPTETPPLTWKALLPMTLWQHR